MFFHAQDSEEPHRPESQEQPHGAPEGIASAGPTLVLGGGRRSVSPSEGRGDCHSGLTGCREEQWRLELGIQYYCVLSSARHATSVPHFILTRVLKAMHFFFFYHFMIHKT